MNVITFRKFSEFAQLHPDSKGQLETLRRKLRSTLFENLNQVKDAFPKVSLLKDNRVVFNICGNKYRLILRFVFKFKTAYVHFIGTHAEYDKIDANTI